MTFRIPDFNDLACPICKRPMTYIEDFESDGDVVVMCACNLKDCPSQPLIKMVLCNDDNCDAVTLTEEEK